MALHPLLRFLDNNDIPKSSHSRHGKPARSPDEPVGSGAALREIPAASPFEPSQQAHTPNPCPWFPRPSPSHAETPASVWKPCLCLCFFTVLLGWMRGGVWVHAKGRASTFGGRRSPVWRWKAGHRFMWPPVSGDVAQLSTVITDSRFLRRGLLPKPHICED